MSETNHVWVVRQNSDLTEGRGPMRDVAVCDSEEEAARVNYDVEGVMGIPRHNGGEIVKITLNVYPLVEEMVFGYRKGWDGQWGYGWVDNRDAPDEDPEYATYLRLRAKFEDR